MGLFEELLDAGEDEKEDGSLSSIPGVAIGVVKENWDKEHPGMVKVELVLGEKEKSILDWMPVAVPYAGKEFGTYFLPEIGSQVLVAFQLGEINSPIVIGCLWNQTDVTPPEAANEKNTVKTIRTKGGNQIVISEESGKEKITVETKGGQKLLLDDENQKMALQDKDGKNAVTLDTKNGEMTFTADKKAVFSIHGKAMLTLDGSGQKMELKTNAIEIEAAQALQLKGQTLKAEGTSTEIKGQSVKVESQAALSLKGTASLKAESSGIAEVKGTMVKIN